LACSVVMSPSPVMSSGFMPEVGRPATIPSANKWCKSFSHGKGAGPHLQPLLTVLGQLTFDVANACYAADVNDRSCQTPASPTVYHGSHTSIPSGVR
jgi:hypothetical protein